jgi:hypothetical protein
MNYRYPSALALLVTGLCSPVLAQGSQIGREVSITRHLRDGEEFTTPLDRLLDHGQRLFSASWTPQEGGGRPLTKGTGAPLADPLSPLEGARGFNRISAPDANSCAGCHNAPLGIAGGGGDFVTNVFVLGQRFDFATFDHGDAMSTRGTMDELGRPTDLQTIANSRSTLGMFGAGYVEMLARQMTADLQAIRDGLAPGTSIALASKGVSFGTLARNADGTWDTSAVEGLPAPSLASAGAASPPPLILRPFHQAGAVVSLRQFSNNAFNHHHGIQTVERFGAADQDGDGFTEEMTIADTTAVSVFQATLAAPGRVIPRDRQIEQAVLRGEDLFVEIGCTDCHVPYLELDQEGWIYSEPNPFNPSGNLTPASPYVAAHGAFEVDLNSRRLPGPRLQQRPDGTVRVPAFTDLKLHDITSGPGDPNREPIDMQQPAGSPGFFAGNGRFLTKKLWGMANEQPYFHHGQYTTIREAVEAHAGEAAGQRTAYGALSTRDQDCLIEFLKTLQVLPPGAKHLTVDEQGRPRLWRPFPWGPA